MYMYMYWPSHDLPEFEVSVAVHPTPSAVCPAPVVALPYLPAPGQTAP